jgi:hypothetical protein
LPAYYPEKDDAMLDLRLPIGMMFTLVGGLLVVYGLVTAGNAELYKHSLGININLWWGAGLTIFGIVMWLMGRRGSPQDKQE